MNVYGYRAFDKQGGVLKGVILGFSGQDALSKIQDQDLDVISCRRSWLRQVAFSHSTQQRYQDLISFCFYLRYFLEAGFSLSHALKEMQLVFGGFFQGVIGSVLNEVQQGCLFSQALQKQAPFMGPVLISLVAVGEGSGRLTQSLQTMISMLNQQHRTRKRIEKALRYPLMLLAVLVCAIGILFFNLVPPFVEFFQSFNVAPSWETQLLISFYHDRQFWGICFGCASIILFVLWVASKQKRVQLHFHPYLIHCPGLGPLWLKLQLQPFLDAWILLLQAQVDLLEGLKLSRLSLRSPYLIQKADTLIDEIQQGQKLSQTLQSASLFSPFFIRMVQLGEETGRLLDSLEHLSHFYAKETKEMLDRFILMLEPCLLVGLGGLILWLVSALFIPLYENLSLLQETA